MKTMKRLMIIFLVLHLASCAYNNLADFDQNTANKIVEISKMVNMFYLQLADRDAADRQYSDFANEYMNIEVELEALLLMNQIIPLNEESITQAQSTLELWQKYKNAHKKKIPIRMC